MGPFRLKHSPHGARSNDRRTFASTSPVEWACATRGSSGWREGVHTWSVRLREGAHGISIGVSRRKISTTDAHANIPKRYDLDCGLGRVVGPQNYEHQYFPGPLDDGVLVSVRLDLDAGTLTYALNGKWIREPAFEGLDDGAKWYPYFALKNEGCAFSLE